MAGPPQIHGAPPERLRRACLAVLWAQGAGSQHLPRLQRWKTLTSCVLDCGSALELLHTYMSGTHWMFLLAAFHSRTRGVLSANSASIQVATGGQN